LLVLRPTYVVAQKLGEELERGKVLQREVSKEQVRRSVSAMLGGAL